jgi:hypothetical protein
VTRQRAKPEAVVTIVMGGKICKIDTGWNKVSPLGQYYLMIKTLINHLILLS